MHACAVFPTQLCLPNKGAVTTDVLVCKDHSKHTLTDSGTVHLARKSIFTVGGVEGEREDEWIKTTANARSAAPHRPGKALATTHSSWHDAGSHARASNSTKAALPASG